MEQAVLITGATGGLGGPLTKRALEEGRVVVAVGRNPEALAALERMGAQTIRGDLREGVVQEAVRARLEGSKMDVIHAAAHSVAFDDPAVVAAHNVGVTQAMVRAFGGTRSGRFLFVSSPSVLLRPCDQVDLTEKATLPVRGYTAYAHSKILGEALVASLGDRGVVVRPRALYGPSDTTLLPRLVRAASQGPMPLLNGGRSLTQLTWMEDAVDGIWRALTCRAAGGEVFHLAGEERWSVRAVIDMACEEVAITPRYVALPVGAMRALAWMSEKKASWQGYAEPRLTRHAVAALAWTQTYSTQKAAQVLGWRATRGFRETLALATSGAQKDGH